MVVGSMVIASFLFFGTYSAAMGAEEVEDQVLCQKVDGSPMMLSEVKKLSRFISTDSGDTSRGVSLVPNLCNNGVIRKDFIRDGLAELIVEKYFDDLLPDFKTRLEKAKRFQSYAHPEAPFLSAKNVWQHFVPTVNAEIAGLQAEEEISPRIFASLAALYQCQGKLQPETLRKILVHHHQQYPWLTVDRKLSHEDLAIFGFHSATDWFGKTFVDLTAEFILNGAAAAEKRGYSVSLDEAKGDLIHNFQTSIKRLKDSGVTPEFGFHQHLRSLGFDVRSASKVWQKVLLFRKLLSSLGESVFMDRLPFKDFAEYAKEKAVVRNFEWPIQIADNQDLAEIKAYMKAIAKETSRPLPNEFLSVEEVRKSHPKLTKTTYRAFLKQVPKSKLGLKVSLKELWHWQTETKNWAKLQKEFTLKNAKSSEERFKVISALEPQTRAKLDFFTREKIVEENPSWLEEAFAAEKGEEKTWTVFGNDSPELSSESVYYKMENLEKVDEKVLTFQEARSYLKEIAMPIKGEFSPEKNPFAICSDAALLALKMDNQDTEWIQSNDDVIANQFKLIAKEQEVFRTSGEDWMKTQAFFMLPDLWSPVHVADNGRVSFFYLKTREKFQEPILEQIYVGKQTLAADAKTYFAESLLKAAIQENAIVIPNCKED